MMVSTGDGGLRRAWSTTSGWSSLSQCWDCRYPATDYRDALSIGTQFGTTYSANGWGAAMSILTCTANILPHLHEEDRPRALYQGLLHVSRECAGKAPRFQVEPLPSGETRPGGLQALVPQLH